jgi:hypothetical protein
MQFDLNKEHHNSKLVYWYFICYISLTIELSIYCVGSLCSIIASFFSRKCEFLLKVELGRQKIDRKSVERERKAAGEKKRWMLRG